MNTKYIKFRLYFSCKRSNIWLKQTAEMGDAVATEQIAQRDGDERCSSLLPPGETSELDIKSFGDNCRSFFVQGILREVDPERIVPTEEVLPGAYIPLFILPGHSTGRWDDDHGRFEINDPRLRQPGRRVLRYTHVQYLPRFDHTRKNRAYDAVRVPVTDTATFEAVLLGAAKYLTKQCIDLSGRRPVIRDTTDAIRAEAHRAQWIRMQHLTQWRVGLYAAQYILQNGIDAVRESAEVARFLEARDEQARKLASFGVVRRAVLQVVGDFEPTYERARRAGAIRRPEPTAARFLTQYFDRHQPDYIPTIADQLLAA